MITDEIVKNVTTDADFAFRWSILMAFPTLSNVLAFLSNALLFAVTVHSNKLGFTCNFLIAFDAFCYAATRFPYFLAFALICAGQPIRWSPCAYIMSVALVGNRTSILLMLVLGIERFFSVLFPIWSKSRNQRAYAFWLGLFAMVHTPYSVYQCLSIGYGRPPESLLFCTSMDVVAGDKNNFVITILNNCVIGATISVYLLLWLKIRFCTLNGASKSKKLFNALAVFVSLNSICSLSVPLTLTVLPTFALSPLNFYIVGQEIQNVAFLANALMPFCLYLLSTTYRNEFKKMFAGMRSLLRL